MELKEFEAAKYFPTAEAQSELLSDALRSGEAGYVASALDTIARARGLDGFIERSAPEPTLAAALRMMRVLGVELQAKLSEAKAA